MHLQQCWTECDRQHGVRGGGGGGACGRGGVHVEHVEGEGKTLGMERFGHCALISINATETTKATNVAKLVNVSI